MGARSEFDRFRMVGDRLFFRLRNVPIDSPAFSLTSHDGIVVLFPESVERISGHSVLAADGRYAVPAVHHAHYFAAVVDELLQFGVAAFAASEYDSLFASQRQRLPCTHGYQVSFDFRHQPECETEHLAVYRVVEGVVIFRAVQADLLFEKFSHDRHDVCQGAAQTGEFRYDHRVSAFHAAQECPEFAFPAFLFSAHDFRHPAIHVQVTAVCEFRDFVLLICQRLFFGADS